VRQIIYEIDRREMMIRYESSGHDVMRQNNYILVVMYSFLRLKLYVMLVSGGNIDAGCVNPSVTLGFNCSN
jgi:hypothetical protein